MILEISESKGAEFQGMNFTLKSIYTELFFNNSKIKAKVRVVYTKKMTCKDRLDS